MDRFVVEAIIEVIHNAEHLDRLAEIGLAIAKDDLITAAEKEEIRAVYAWKLRELRASG